MNFLAFDFDLVLFSVFVKKLLIGLNEERLFFKEEKNEFEGTIQKSIKVCQNGNNFNQ